MNNEEFSRYRKLKGPAGFIWRSLLILIPLTGIAYILSIYQYFGLYILREQYTGWFLAIVLAAVFLGRQASRREGAANKVPWYDWILAILGFSVGMYIVIFYPKIIYDFNVITPVRLLICGVAILLILEALRRMVGWILVIILFLFFTYSVMAPVMPGAFRGQATSLDQLINYLYLDTSSLLSLINIAATLGLAFVLFGQVLITFKGGDIFNNIALRIFGKYRGGPAKASIVGSGMVGSITGGPVANIMLTGTMTIPLMIRTGYTRAQAGAIESVASSGGAIMPPIMGIVAFVMAEILNVPYREVALAALVPAILYYLCLFIQVDLMAAKSGAGKVPKNQIPPLSQILKTGWILIPIFTFLVYFLFVKGFPPAITGVYTAGVGLIVLLIQKDVRKGLIFRIKEVLEETGKSMLEVTIILSAAGFMVGIIGITGLGFNLVAALAQFGEHGLFILLLASAIVCVVLGMGMPALAAYSIVAVLIAPSLIELGVQPMAAHLFVFYFANVSNFTPPIALACFVAAPIAKESPHKIGFESMKLGIMAYVTPFLFVYNPIILYDPNQNYNYVGLIGSIVLAVIACIILSISVSGYLFSSLNILKRIMLAVIAILMFIPAGVGGQEWLMNGIWLVLFMLIVLYEWVKHKKTVNYSKSIQV